MPYTYLDINTPIKSEPYAPWNLGHICEIRLDTRELSVYPVIFEDKDKYICLQEDNYPCTLTKINENHPYTQHRAFTSYEAYQEYCSERKDEWRTVNIYVPKKHTKTYSEILHKCVSGTPYDKDINITKEHIDFYNQQKNDADRHIKHYTQAKAEAEQRLKDASERLEMLERKKKQYKLSKAAEISNKDYKDNGVITTNAQT